MKYMIQINGTLMDERFDDEAAVKAYLQKLKWATDQSFVIEDEDDVPVDVSVDELFIVLNELNTVEVFTPCMCEMGDDYVELSLIAV